jgi:transposase-like protein
VHNWVHKADLQPESGKNPDHIVLDETVIQLNDEQYWLCAAVDPETNELLDKSLEPTTNTVIAQSFFAEINEKHDVSDAVFLVDGSTHYKLRVTEQATISDMKNMEIGMPSNVSSEKQNAELYVSRTVSATLNRHRRRLDQITQLRMEPAYLDTTVYSIIIIL